MWRRSASFVLDKRLEQQQQANLSIDLMDPQNPKPNPTRGISAYYQTRADHHAVVTSDWLAQAKAAVVGDSSTPERSSGVSGGCSVIDEFNYWRKKPDLAEAVAAIMALSSVIRSSEATTMMELEIELKRASDSLKERWAKTVVILITPPPIDEDGRIKNPYGDNHSGLPERTNESAGSYAKECLSFAKESGIPVIDLWSKMQQFSGWEKSYLRDGLHFTPHGNRILFEEVVGILRDEGLSLETLPVDQPLFSDIDHQDPLKTFTA